MSKNLFNLLFPLLKKNDSVRIPLRKEKPKQDILKKSDLVAAMPSADITDIDFYFDSLNKVLPEFGIDTPLRISHFMAQIGHESGCLRFNKENLNYSANALISVFGKYFDTEQKAEACARKPQEIANIVYAGRMGNTDTNDGWKYRGRGLIQLTGKYNYQQCGEALGIDLVNNPDLVNSDSEVCVKVACWYWTIKKLNYYADKDDISRITKLINGGYNGLDHRKKLLSQFKEVLIKTA